MTSSLRPFTLALFMVACGSSDAARRTSTLDAGNDGASDGTGGRGSGGSSTGGAPVGGRGGASTGGAPSGGAGGASTGGSAGGAPLDGGADAASEAGDAATDAPPVVLPDGIIADVAYTCTSPFAGVRFPAYFHLEDMEDGVFDPPGVTATANQLSSSFGAGYVDSIDCDDGVVDGACTGCEALYANGSIELTFDDAVLGGLPTHTGLVWTDGGFGTTVTIEAFDAGDVLIDTQTVPGIGDGSNSGTVDEDRFFGIVHAAGVKKITVLNDSGGLEIDHFQYGR